GLGQAGLVALCAGGLLDDRVQGVVALGMSVSLVTEGPYPAGTRMGLLSPGILRVGDIAHLASLTAPRRLIVAGGVTSQGQAVTEQLLRETFAPTQSIYRLHRAEARLSVMPNPRENEIVTSLQGL